MQARTATEVKLLLDHERAGAPFVAFRDGDDALHVRTLGAGEPLLTIGRDVGCAIALAWDTSVSRTHAILERVGSLWTVSDDGLSTNGTFVNARRLTSRHRLADRDTLGIGDTALLFREPAVGGASGAKTRLVTAVAAVDVTPMQRKVLVALCRPILRDTTGVAAPASNAEIAAELVLSVDAVKTHMRALFDRLAVGDLAQNQKRARVAELAIRAGMVSSRDL
jgi:pSer/pThr/pTyr-binding forkhead associated (FHA) protein